MLVDSLGNDVAECKVKLALPALLFCALRRHR